MEVPSIKSDKKIPEFLIGGGEMGQRIREFDWSTTPLGPVDSWPRSLRTCVQIMLTSRQPIWIGWSRELIKLYNDPYLGIVGGKHPWALGKPASVVWRDIWKDIHPMLEKVMHHNEGTYVESQLLIMERNGYPEETYYTFSYTPIAGDNGETEGMICANTDDTYRIISERQLRTLTQLGKALTDVKSNREVLDGTIETLAQNAQDFPFALLYTYNNGVLKLDAHTDVGESISRIPAVIDLSSGHEVAQLCTKAVRTRKAQVFDNLREKLGDMPKGAWHVTPEKAIVLPVTSRRQADPYALLVVGMNPFRLLDEKYQSFFELVADQVATSLGNVYAQEQERRRLEALAEIDRAKTAFFSNISHEFRTPLTLLLGPMEDLLSDGALNGNAREKATVAFRNALRMQKLVNLLLDFSRIEAGRMEAHFTAVDIVELTGDLASNFRSAIERAGMTLALDMEPVGEPVYVDPDMWEKIILNLISNAFKYSERGTIKVSSRKKDRTVEIAITDTGIGIPETELTRIFERFHRVQNVNGRSQEGTGIGLAMVRELVKLHGGTITVKSTLGEGSTFTIAIPLGTGHLNGKISTTATAGHGHHALAYIQEAAQWTGHRAETPETAEMEKPVVKQSHAYTVLLADDNSDMRVFVSRLLESAYNVIMASDGEEAFEKARTHSPDLILSDIMMPRVDGFGLLKKIRENLGTRSIPFIFLSARAGEEAKVEGLNAGADDYLTKPFSSRELQARVANHISISKTRLKTEKEFFNLFRQSPAHIHVMKGPDHVVEFFHPLGIQMIGKDITGMKIREAVPFLEGQGFFELLDKVYHEGVPVSINESKATFPTPDGKTRDHYFNITYVPWRDLEGNVQGVLQFTFEVTETVELRLKAEANEKKFRSIAHQAPVAMALLMGPEFMVEVANDKVLQLWNLNHADVIGRSVLDLFPEIVGQGFGELLRKVYETGEPFLANEMPVTFGSGGTAREMFVNLLYEPFRNESNEIEGIVAVGTDVTEQVVARRRVADAELRARTIIEQTPSPLCIFKGDDLVLEVANEAALATWQVGPEVIGLRLADIVPEMQRQIFTELMQDVYRNGVTRYGFEAPAFFVRADGTTEHRFFNFFYVPFYNSEREIIGVLVLATDVTEQVHAKKQLTDNEERLRIASEILELGTWEIDVKQSRVYLSERTRELLGMPLENKPESSVPIELVAAHDRQKVEKAIAGSLEGSNGGKLDIEFSVIPAAGERIIRSIGQTFFDSYGHPQRMIGTAIDITERKKAEENLRASEERFRLLTSSIPQIVWTSDPQGKTTFISDQFETFTGCSVSENLNTWMNLIHPDDRDRLMHTRILGIQASVGWQEEFRLRDAQGGYRWFLANSNPLKDAEGNVVMYVGAASDIQNLKEQSEWLESQVQERTRSLKELNQSLKQSNEDLQQFAHVASHDLKEPIRKIKTFGNRLRDEYTSELPEKARNFVEKIISATDRMYNMIDGVLSYSTYASLEEPMELVDLNSVIENIQTDLEVVISERGATLTVSRLPVIPGASVLFYQLFYNLINNSLKFVKKGEAPSIRITASKEVVEGIRYEKIVVSDNGIGFAQDQAEKIFTTFTRLNSKDRFEGTGLGLALCRKIVQRHHGYISARSEPDAGAEFTILLPSE